MRSLNFVTFKHDVASYGKLDIRSMQQASFPSRQERGVTKAVSWVLACAWVMLASISVSVADDSNRFARADSRSNYVHWIDLYDNKNNRIDPDSELALPYSPEHTCGRCHDFDSISHGWHFDATDPDASAGRNAQPWLWNDERTGTTLPLSYRKWPGTFDPDRIGISRWEMAQRFGGYTPGGGFGSSQALGLIDSADETLQRSDEDRSLITGPLPVDCMMCHRGASSRYEPVAWMEQVEKENFAYAPSVAAALGTIEGDMRRVKEPLDANDEADREKLPTFQYEADVFRTDGKAFFDIVRKPRNESCFHCHTNITTEQLGGSRWHHDQDIHLRAGLACADCHRNGIDHETVRGYDSEALGAKGKLLTQDGRQALASLSCQGCHVGESQHGAHGTVPNSIVGTKSSHSKSGKGDQLSFAGRFGAPQPEHRGLPPIHFEKLTCTACHSGPILQPEAPRWLNSIAHRLGDKAHRTGSEPPQIVGPVMLPLDSEFQVDASHGVYTPARLIWPSYWGLIADGEIEPLPPDEVYGLTRKATRVRKSFSEELVAVKLSSKQKKEILGEERYKVDEDDWSEEERLNVESAVEELRTQQIREKIVDALQAIQEAFPDRRAAYVNAGQAIMLNEDQSDYLVQQGSKFGNSVAPYHWPIGHDVRPARQSLGVNGCTECHSQDSPFFHGLVQAEATLPIVESEPANPVIYPVEDAYRLSLWNQLFAGRSAFKLVTIAIVSLIGLVVFSSLFTNFSSWLSERFSSN